MNQKWIALLLALILALSVCGCAADKPQTETAETTASVETQTAAGQGTVTDEELTQTAQWLMEQIPQPTYGSVGGEWAVFGLARSGVAVPKEYFEVYGENVAAYTAEHGGVLHAKKYTEYSRVILAGSTCWFLWRTLIRRYFRGSTAPFSHCWRWTAGRMTSRKTPPEPRRPRGTGMWTIF